MSKKIIVALESGDGLGKTTQCDLLAKAIDAKIVKYPYYDTLSGRVILDILEGRTIIDSNKGNRGLIIQSLMTINRYETLHMIPTDCNIVFDRYSMSSYIYGGMDGLPEDFVESINSMLIKPDLTIVMVGEPFRLNGDYYERSEKQRIVNKLYLERAKHLSYPTVNANQSIEKVHTDIMNIVMEKYDH